MFLFPMNLSFFKVCILFRYLSLRKQIECSCRWLRYIKTSFFEIFFQNVPSFFGSLPAENTNKLDLTGKNQHGFKRNRSTATAGALLQSIIARAADDKCYVLMASLDLFIANSWTMCIITVKENQSLALRAWATVAWDNVRDCWSLLDIYNCKNVRTK